MLEIVDGFLPARNGHEENGSSENGSLDASYHGVACIGQASAYSVVGFTDKGMSEITR